MMRSVVLTLVVGVGFPLTAGAADGITSGQEFTLLTDGPGKGIQATPAVAAGHGIYLVVWREGWHGKGGSARIYAARVSVEGKQLDPRGIEVAPASAGVQERPRVACAGDTFLIVWQDLRNGKDYDVLGARIDRNGKVKDRKPIVVAAGPGNQVLPDIASDGERFVVVWQGLHGEDPTYRGYAAAVSVAGKVGPAVETGVTPQPRVAWNGSHYLAAGGGAGAFKGNVLAVRLHADGTPQGKPAVVIRGTKAAAFSLCGVPPRGWLVVSHRSPPDPWGWGGPGAIRAAFVNTKGQTTNEDALKEPAGVKERLPGWLDMGLARSSAATWPWGPNASAFDGRQTVVVWQRHHLCGEKWTNFENCDLIAARVSGHRSLDPQGIPVAASRAEEQAPTLASAGTGRFLLIYERHEGAGRVLIAGRLLRAK
jgi:hypothetical protein